MHTSLFIHTFTIIGVGVRHLITFSAATGIASGHIGAHLLAGICGITLIDIWGEIKRNFSTAYLMKQRLLQKHIGQIKTEVTSRRQNVHNAIIKN